MIHLLVNWLLSAILILVVAHIVSGFEVKDFTSALVAAAVIGLVNGTIGAMLQFIAFPLTFLTLGLFSLVINAAMLLLASKIVPGFKIRGFLPAFIGALLLSILRMLLHRVM